MGAARPHHYMFAVDLEIDVFEAGRRAQFLAHGAGEVGGQPGVDAGLAEDVTARHRCGFAGHVGAHRAEELRHVVCESLGIEFFERRLGRAFVRGLSPEVMDRSRPIQGKNSCTLRHFFSSMKTQPSP